jgi:hypothetical protein
MRHSVDQVDVGPRRAFSEDGMQPMLNHPAGVNGLQPLPGWLSHAL